MTLVCLEGCSQTYQISHNLKTQIAYHKILLAQKIYQKTITHLPHQKHSNIIHFVALMKNKFLSQKRNKEKFQRYLIKYLMHQHFKMTST
jgi:hypothetical protein